MTYFKAEMKKRCANAKKDAAVYDAIQNEIMCEFFGDDYYDHIGENDAVEAAYNKTSEIRADFVLKIGQPA